MIVFENLYRAVCKAYTLLNAKIIQFYNNTFIKIVRMVGEEFLKKLNKEIRESRIYMNHIQLNNVELQIVQFLFEHEK